MELAGNRRDRADLRSRGSRRTGSRPPSICSTTAGRRRGAEGLAGNGALSEKLLLEWVNHADLCRLDGVAGEYADLLGGGRGRQPARARTAGMPRISRPLSRRRMRRSTLFGASRPSLRSPGGSSRQRGCRGPSTTEARTRGRTDTCTNRHEPVRVRARSRPGRRPGKDGPRQPLCLLDPPGDLRLGRDAPNKVLRLIRLRESGGVIRGIPAVRARAGCRPLPPSSRSAYSPATPSRRQRSQWLNRLEQQLLADARFLGESSRPTSTRRGRADARWREPVRLEARLRRSGRSPSISWKPISHSPSESCFQSRVSHAPPVQAERSGPSAGARAKPTAIVGTVTSAALAFKEEDCSS